jgi:hypothetical protein
VKKVSGYKPKRSTKSATIKNAIIARRASGESKAQIARELDIATNTVSSILELSDFERMRENGDLATHKLIPKSVAVLDTRLDLIDLDAAKYVLSNTIFSDRHGRRAVAADVNVNVALATYISKDDTKTESITTTEPISNTLADTK